MRKFILLAVICASLSLPLCTLFVVRATTSVKSINDVQLGMDMLDVLAGLQGKYSIDSFDVEKGMRHYSITGGLDRHFDYEIITVNGKVASVWRNDAKAYSGDTFIVGSELFDALYSQGQLRNGNAGDRIGVRDVNVSVQLQKPTYDSFSRTLIFNLPDEDFRLRFYNSQNGTPSVEIQRVRALDEKSLEKLSTSPEAPH
jgi:hypothetical protein